MCGGKNANKIRTSLTKINQQIRNICLRERQIERETYKATDDEWTDERVKEEVAEAADCSERCAIRSFSWDTNRMCYFHLLLPSVCMNDFLTFACAGGAGENEGRGSSENCKEK